MIIIRTLSDEDGCWHTIKEFPAEDSWTLIYLCGFIPWFKHTIIKSKRECLVEAVKLAKSMSGDVDVIDKTQDKFPNYTTFWRNGKWITSADFVKYCPE